ncbi:hypothetical protein [Cryobacterium sp. BB736]|uniref:hypothetical protein n=1 Tax=Cryobacterium sp. BB736 TaxID=2746963 RepID=UPI00187341C3|nr:hypothetical protein [Cryobacterium sp. BB736]
MTNDLPDDDTPLDPAAMLALLEQQQRKVNNDLIAPVPWILLVWGFAWLLGFLALWSMPGGGNPLFEVPPTIAWLTFVALLIVAIVVSAILGSRIGRGVRGASGFSGAVYGLSWTFGSIAAAGIGAGMVRLGMSSDLAGVLFPALYGLVAGLLYLAGATIWRSISQLVLGLWLLLVSTVSVFAGLPHNYLVMGLAGGGAFLVYGIVLFIIRARSRQ